MNQPVSRELRWPAEWEPQSATMLTWPPKDGDWGDALPAAEIAVAGLAAVITRYQPVVIAAPDDAESGPIPAAIAHHGGRPDRTFVYPAPADDIWARDHGPLTVVDAGEACCLDFRFNGWGGKHACRRDDALTARLHRAGAFGDVRLRAVDAVLEGGAVDTDGNGTILTTRRCLLHPGRNPGADTAWYEDLFRRELGASRTLWLDHGALDGDDTDGHVDMLARFVARDTIAYTACDDPADSHYAELAALARELAALRDRTGAPYRLIPLPWPSPVHDGQGRRLPATYANFLILNDAVLVPAYGVAQDDTARDVIARAFPDRDVLSLDATTLITQGGALHCATMQLPAA